MSTICSHASTPPTARGWCVSSRRSWPAASDKVRAMDMWIDGAEVAGSERFERRSPANGEVVASYPEAGAAEVEHAIAAARRAFDDGRWSQISAQKRANVLRKTADLL